MEAALACEDDVAADELLSCDVEIGLHPIGNVGIIGDGIGDAAHGSPCEICKGKTLLSLGRPL